MRKKAVDMPFSWLFAIIAGAVILFLAIYGASKFIDVAKHREYTEATKSLSILIDPLETGIASTTGYPIHFRRETRTYYNCYTPNSADVFGKQTIQFSEQSGLKQEWANPGGEITLKNKFIFSEQMEQGENLYLFSKPFFLGFKVADIIIASSSNYCFVAPVKKIEEEISFLSGSLKNINITNTLKNCENSSKKVCFDNSMKECDIVVKSSDDYETGTIEKDQQTMFFSGELVYAGIFSSPEIYECNIVRLARKTASLAEVYKEKINIVKQESCNSIIDIYLDQIITESRKLKDSRSMWNLYDIATKMDLQNKDAICKIYGGKDY